MISEESRLSVSSQAHLNKWCVSSTNGHVKPWELKSQQKDLMQVLRRPVETTPRKRTFGGSVELLFYAKGKEKTFNHVLQNILTGGSGVCAMPQLGHERRFKRKPLTSASPPIADISLRRTARQPNRLTRNEARRTLEPQAGRRGLHVTASA